jgi:hypothetical protein
VVFTLVVVLVVDKRQLPTAVLVAVAVIPNQEQQTQVVAVVHLHQLMAAQVVQVLL